MRFRLPAPKTYSCVYNVFSKAGWKKTGKDIKWSCYWGKLKKEMEYILFMMFPYIF